jgi:hypothetical protein
MNTCIIWGKAYPVSRLGRLGDHYCVLFRGVSGERKTVPFNFPWRAPVHADISGVSM